MKICFCPNKNPLRYPTCTESECSLDFLVKKVDKTFNIFMSLMGIVQLPFTILIYRKWTSGEEVSPLKVGGLLIYNIFFIIANGYFLLNEECQILKTI